MSLRRIFWLVFCISQAPMYVFVLYGQETWGFDKAGLGYTLYCSIAFSLVVAVTVSGVVALGRKR